jgi:two-component system sensor histidine kinase YesM
MNTYFNEGMENFTIKSEGQSYLVTCVQSPATDLILAKVFQEDAFFGRLRTLNIYFWVLTLVAIGLGALFFKNLLNMVGQSYRQELLVQQSELKQLQTQINPHFLYNSLFTITNMLRQDENETAKLFTHTLGRYFQFITKYTSDEIKLADEAAHAKTYAEIQMRRFRERIKVSFEPLDEAAGNHDILRLTIQPMIENAFEHGLKNKVHGGIINVAYSFDEHYFCVTVEDNGDELSQRDIDEVNHELKADHENTEITGLINVHKRLAIKYGNNSGVSVSRSELGGMKSQIRVKI